MLTPPPSSLNFKEGWMNYWEITFALLYWGASMSSFSLNNRWFYQRNFRKSISVMFLNALEYIFKIWLGCPKILGWVGGSDKVPSLALFLFGCLPLMNWNAAHLNICFWVSFMALSSDFKADHPVDQPHWQGIIIHWWTRSLTDTPKV